MTLEILIWNVEHGASVSVQAPNQQVLMMDCSFNPHSGFSPVLATQSHWGQIDLLIVSHPHIDHISDINNIDYYEPPMLLAPFVPYAQLREGKYGDYSRIIEDYIALRRRAYAPNLNPHSWGNAVISSFGLQGYQYNINDYSLVTFLTYGGFTFAYAGDISSTGWDRLISQYGTRLTRMLQRTNFFMASHHGREEGYNDQVMGYMRSLRLVFISDKHVQPTSVTGRYSEWCRGWNVVDEEYDSTNRRYVLTTRKDGRIRIEVTRFNRRTCVEVSTRVA